MEGPPRRQREVLKAGARAGRAGAPNLGASIREGVVLPGFTKEAEAVDTLAGVVVVAALVVAVETVVGARRIWLVSRTPRTQPCPSAALPLARSPPISTPKHLRALRGRRGVSLFAPSYPQH